MKNSILADCIVTAKAVKATAMANAKASLDEAFNQRFSAVFADKLREDSAAEMEEENPVAPVAETTVDETIVPEKATPSKSDGTKIWSKDNLGCWKADSHDQTPDNVPTAKDGGDATKGWSKDNKGNAFDGTPKGVKENTTNTTEVEEIAESNEDLDEIIRELEAEAAADASAPGSDPTTDMTSTDATNPSPDTTATTPEAGTPILAGTPVILQPAPESDAQPEPPTTEEPAQEPPTESPVGAPTEAEGAMEEEIDLNELLNSLNEESKEKDDNKHEEKESDKKEKEEEEKVDESAQFQSQLNEAISQRDDALKAVDYLKKQLNEINILNAKLLYTNKLFKEFSMNNDNKMKIVESFDLTKTVREVKMTYANWCGSLNFGGNSKKKAPASNTLTTITEGLASKPVSSTKPSTVVINEGNDMALRFKKLAGIRG